MLDIFLSNKIPSTLEGWTDDLAVIATIYDKFDGKPYDYQELTEGFAEISHRQSGARDPSFFRDSHGAYGTNLGIYYLQHAGDKWIFRMNPNARVLLCGDYPDPQAYVRMAMTLLQYPHPIGVGYLRNGRLRRVGNALDVKKRHVGSGLQTAPFRLLLRVLLALHGEHGPDAAYLDYNEIWHCLFRRLDAVGTFDPDGSMLADRIMGFRLNPVAGHDTDALRNLHILKHTGILEREEVGEERGRLRLLPEAGNPEGRMGRAARAIAAMTSHYPIPRQEATKDEIGEWVLRSHYTSEWGRYFAGETIPAAAADAILDPAVLVEYSRPAEPAADLGAPLLDFSQQRRERARQLERRPSSPEEAEVLRERANLAHRTLLGLIKDRMLALPGYEPQFNKWIDLCSLGPTKLLIEVKSCHPSNLLQQVRKGISQLYEYRFRHEELRDSRLVLALETEPGDRLGWLVDYLVRDREICVCWLEGENNLACPPQCHGILNGLVNYAR